MSLSRKMSMFRTYPQSSKPFTNYLLNFLRSKGDTSNYSTYPDSTEMPKAVKSTEDPFIGW